MSSAAKVGAFMLGVLLILAFFVLRIEDLKIREAAETKKITAIFDSVAGLDNKSVVRVAGVRVGKVTNIKLRPDGRAEVTLDVDKEVQLHRNATAKVANLGLLGEKYVELDPGNPNLPAIAVGPDQKIVLRGSQPASFDDVTNQVSAIADDVKAITASLRGAMSGQAGQQRIEDILENTRIITLQVRELLAANRQNVDATTGNLAAITANLRTEIPKLAASIDRVVNAIGGTVGENRQDVHVVVENLKKLSEDLKITTANVNAITGQVKSGEGTVGKLLYSDEAHEKLTSALTSVESGVTELKNTLGRANRITMDLGIKSQYYAGLDPKLSNSGDNIGGNSRASVQLDLQPNPDRNRYYHVELADDPRGHRQEKIFETTVTDPAGVTRTTTTREVKFDRNFLLSAQAAWRLDDLALRIGLFDSTGGVGADYRYNDRVSFTGEAFDFGKKRDPNPHVRLFSDYTVRRERPNFPQIFVSAGLDNALNDRAFTIGGGIRWRDDDLKYLLGSLPIK
jgi:phospholipid/cholesterol/gamma-HCH transport system substrate-binding protein